MPQFSLLTRTGVSVAANGYTDMSFNVENMGSMLFAVPFISTASESPNYGSLYAAPTAWSTDAVNVRIYNASDVQPTVTVRVLLVAG